MTARRETRAARCRRARSRAITVVDASARDPLVRSRAHPGRRVGRGAWLVVIAALVHLCVLSGFVAASWISRALEEAEPPLPEPEEVAVIEPLDEREDERPPPEPEHEPPPPTDAFEDGTPPPVDAAPEPQLGISAGSTVEGGDGPAFQTGDSLAGPTGGDGLARELLGREPERDERPEHLVMTGDTVDTQPVPFPSNRPPATPPKARQRGIGGHVLVRMLIGQDGAVQEVQVLEASPPGLFEGEVMEVVPTWRFTPATYQGQPVVMRVDQTIRFEVG